MGALLVNPVWAVEDFIFSINSPSEFEVGQFPVIHGKAVTLDNNPVSDVQIKVNFPSGDITTLTNSTGQFSAISPVLADIGEYTITVYAKKDNKYANVQFTYQVTESKVTIAKETPKPLDETLKTDEHVELDPFSKMIKQIEEQKLEEEKEKSLTKKQQQVEEQRLFAKADLQKDLIEAEKRNESNSPRNVFYRFIQDVDSSVRGIFWQQFLFTEKITKEAQEAKENALEEGKSSFEAMKIFQKEAAVTQKEVMDFNKNLSVRYGNATNVIQEQFDEKGKLPREE